MWREEERGDLLALVTTVGGRTSRASIPKVTILRVVPLDNCWMNLEQGSCTLQKRKRRGEEEE